MRQSWGGREAKLGLPPKGEMSEKSKALPPGGEESEKEGLQLTLKSGVPPPVSAAQPPKA
jgi:hypothetical protein